MTRRGLTLLGSLAFFLALSGTVAAQGGQPAGDSMADPALNLLVTAIGTAIYMGMVLVVGGITVFLAPDFVRGVDREIRESPVLAGLVGLGLFVGILVVVVLLVLVAFTGIGLLIAIPGFLALFVVGLLAEAMIAVSVGFVLAGVLDREGIGLGWAFLVGLLAITVVAVIPIVGLLTFVLTAVGAGGLAIHLWNRFQGEDDGPEPEEPDEGAWTASDHVASEPDGPNEPGTSDDYSRS
jgi:hypothetical protein